MIRGIGIDICDISRMRKAVSREGFCRRVFSEGERAYAEQSGPGGTLRRGLAAREALSKATGWG